VGGSAGGLDAYIRFLRCLPADIGAAIVIGGRFSQEIAAQHYDCGVLAMNDASVMQFLEADQSWSRLSEQLPAKDK
jgi:chemotaxis response regulator CheB